MAKYSPAKRPLTGETLESLTAALAERGEKAFRARQILDWVYKKRAGSKPRLRSCRLRWSSIVIRRT
jgi:adenine C2-methylase RlmN of 23S rRNA A2503 and tRNA A37